MQRYIIIAVAASFNSGILELSPDQASRRPHALAALGDDLYEVRQPVQFKTGEVVGYDGDVNKALLQLVEPTEAEIGKAAPASKPERKAATGKVAGKAAKSAPDQLGGDKAD